MHVYIRKLDFNKYWLEMSMLLVGALMVSAALLADLVGVGGQSEFGLKQSLLAALGGGMLLTAVMDLIAQRYGWESEIPTLTEIKTFTLKKWNEFWLVSGRIEKLWIDGLIVFILIMVVSVGSYLGAKLIDPIIYQHDTLSVWFESDPPRIIQMLVDRLSGHHIRISVHPMFALVGYPFIFVLHNIAGIELFASIRIFVTTQAVLWVVLLYVILRLINCRRFDAMLFSIVGITSASAMFWFVVPESFLPGAITIMLALITVILAQRRNISPLWYAVLNALTMGFTVTNWMAGAIATIVGHSLKRTIQIMVNGFFVAVILWMISKVLFPQADFLFFTTKEETFLFNSYSGGPLNILTSFTFHTMIMPAFELIDRYSVPPVDWPHNWPLMITQYSLPGSGPQPWGIISVILWGALLTCGIWAIFRLKEQAKFRIALGLMILGQLVLNLVYGDETFLYSIHYTALFVVLVALSSLTRMRPVILTLAGALALTMVINNGLQFMNATRVVNCLIQNDRRILEKPILAQTEISVYLVEYASDPPIDKAKLVRVCGKTDNYENLLPAALRIASFE